MNIKFQLKDPSKAISSIRLLFYYKSKRFVYGTGKSINPKLWDFKNHKPTTDKSLMEEFAPSELNIKSYLKNLTRHLEDFADECDEYITYQEKKRLPVSFDDLRDKLNSEIKGIEVENISSSRKTVSNLIETFVNGISQGTILTPKKKTIYKKSTIKNYRGFQAQWKEFTESINMKIYLEEISNQTYDDVVYFFNCKEYAANTTGRMIKHWKKILNYGLLKKIHINTIHISPYFACPRSPSDNIYLTTDELDTLYNFKDFTAPSHEFYRDLFLIGCETMQRYSDYSRIKPIHKFSTKKGDFIKLKQEKTGRKVTIVISPRLDKLLTKYNYNLPKSYPQHLNERIKIIASDAKIDTDLEVTEYKGGQEKTVVKRKCDLIKTHTCRRTGITNAYLAGMSLFEIKSTSGHSTTDQLENYIKIKGLEIAENLASHEYYNRSVG